MSAAPKNLDEIKEWIRTRGASPIEPQAAPSATGVTSLDEAMGGGFPTGAITVLQGLEGVGRMSVAVAWVRQETREGRVAWIDGEGVLYPPALAQRGVDLTRLLLVRPKSAEGAVAAAEQIILSKAFGGVILSGLDDAYSAARIRRLQLASRTSGTVTMIIAGEKARVSGDLTLHIQRRGDRIVAETKRSRLGLVGRRASLALAG